MAADKPGFLEELKRRHVWRVAIAYAIAGWLIVQIASQVFSIFHMPDWTSQFVVILVVIGFVVAVVWSWIYEVTPEGIRRTAPADSPEAREAHDTQAVGRKLNTVIITVLALAVLLLLGNQFVWHKGMRASVAASNTSSPGSPDGAKRNPGMSSASSPDSAAAAAASGLRDTANATPLPASTAAIPQKSVAVLPFANESGKADEQFFSDGLSDDLINALSQFAGLKVISRNSAFQFRDSKDPSAKIGQLLGVAHLLEGSVQRAGNAVRITATLVNAADGSTLWSQQYDKPYQDLFALQDAITNAVATALKAKLLTAPGAVVQSDRPASGNLEAYAAYQHGNAYRALGTEASMRLAINAYGLATHLDPRYTVAFARLSVAWTGLASRFVGGAEAEHALAEAHKASDAALTLDPDSSIAHLARSYLLRTEMDWRGAELEAQRALRLAPNNAAARFNLSEVLSSLGQNRRSLELATQALASDPRRAGWYSSLALTLAAVGELDAATHAINTAIALQPSAIGSYRMLAIIEILRGDSRAALNVVQREPSGDAHYAAVALALVLQIGPDRTAADAALKALIAKYADVAPYQVAEVYALRRDPNNVFKWLDHAWASRDPGVGYLLYDPMILRYRDDPRFAAFAKKVGLPTTTDAVSMK